MTADMILLHEINRMNKWKIHDKYWIKYDFIICKLNEI